MKFLGKNSVDGIDFVWEVFDSIWMKSNGFFVVEFDKIVIHLK